MSFDNLWQQLYDHGATNTRRAECAELWESLDDRQRDQLFNTISNKLNIGKFVHYDPLRAMRENIRQFKPRTPEFLTGKLQEQNWKHGIPMVQVKYGGKYLICTQQTQQDFNLPLVKPWLKKED